MSLFSSTASLRSSILRSIEENGRKYHGYKDGKYVLPDDQVSLSVTDLSTSGVAVSLTLSSKNSTGKVRPILLPLSMKYADLFDSLPV